MNSLLVRSCINGTWVSLMSRIPRFFWSRYEQSTTIRSIVLEAIAPTWKYVSIGLYITDGSEINYQSRGGLLSAQGSLHQCQSCTWRINNWKIDFKLCTGHSRKCEAAYLVFLTYSIAPFNFLCFAKSLATTASVVSNIRNELHVQVIFELCRIYRRPTE